MENINIDDLVQEAMAVRKECANLDIQIKKQLGDIPDGTGKYKLMDISKDIAKMGNLLAKKASSLDYPQKLEAEYQTVKKQLNVDFRSGNVNDIIARKNAIEKKIETYDKASPDEKNKMAIEGLQVNTEGEKKEIEKLLGDIKTLKKEARSLGVKFRDISKSVVDGQAHNPFKMVQEAEKSHLRKGINVSSKTSKTHEEK